MTGESNFIAWLVAQQYPSPVLHIGIGDDLAALRWPANDLLLVGVDQVLDGMHFDSAVHSPQAIGRKVMNRNLSDCAAMACLPSAALVAMTVPKGIEQQYVQDLFAGIKQAADIFDCPIVGGDTASWRGKLLVSVTILGRSEGIEPVRRTGAKSGDHIYVTGPLGGSILGRHMTFEPRIALARELAKRFEIHSMTDISDGIARDLTNICRASNVGAVIMKELLPIHTDVSRLIDTMDPAIHALCDGEDYELIVITPDTLPEHCIRIGHIQSSPELVLESGDADVAIPLSKLSGWEHRF